MSKPFVHLHNHTEYSLLDGAQRIPEMVARAKELGMPAIAITDHGAMYGVIEFFYECRKQGVKPIIGMEAYVAPQGRHLKTGREENSTYHLLLLAKNRTGYRNLCRLATIAALEGFYYKPRIDHEALRNHAEGLIATTTCLGSEVNQYLLRGDYDLAQRTAGMYREIFGEGNYFVELQDHRLDDQATIKQGLLRIAKELKLPVVCTNDSHYLCKSDHVAHDVLLCIQTGKRVADEDRMRFDTEEFHLKSVEEMEELFGDTPEAIENTLAVADMVDFDLDEERAELPDPIIPHGVLPDDFLRQTAEEYLTSTYDGDQTVAKERVDYELGVIRQTGFAKYFLLVREFAMYARENGIHFGVRGSAAGSFVSYCIGITDVDPIEYDLTFERFLNPERIQMPDIDMDFEDARRDEVIQYVRDRFGDDHVAQIVTFGSMGAKQAIRDAGRALGMTVADVDKICKIIPGAPGFTLGRALEEITEFRQLYQRDRETHNLIDTAKKIEGVVRHAGVHAAGVVISKDPLSEKLPLAKGSDDQIITQYQMGDLEKIGLLKMDFLGLSNLTVLGEAVKNIEKSGKGKIDLKEIPLTDKKTFAMLSRGETTGVFQLESEGMRKYIAQLKPNSVQELTAMVALYRPGPIEHIPRYIENKHGRKKPEYLHPLMEPILRETYGVITYQDQVLQLVRALAGFTLGKADILRRAMGKKDKALLGSMKVEFMQGASERQIDPATCEQVWTLLEPFADYAFNKAHAVCYALIAYQTAFLKANYQIEYMAALLGAYRGNEARMIAFFEECRRLGIEVLPPDINRSVVDFTIEDGSIRIGLGAIRGIGDSAIQSIINARGDEPFTHLYDLTTRSRQFGGLNRLGLEALIKSGALDSIDTNRNKHLEMLETAIAFADNAERARESGQGALFGEDQSSTSGTAFPILPNTAPPSNQQILAMEKEVLGIFVSDHPLRGHEKLIEATATKSAGSVAELEDGDQIVLAGIVAGKREARTREKNELMAVLTLEDFTGQATITVFPKEYARLANILEDGVIVAVHGTIKQRPRGTEVIARRVEKLTARKSAGETTSAPEIGRVVVRIIRATNSELCRALELIRCNPGEFEIQIEVLKSKNGAPIAASARPYRVFNLPHRVSDGPWLHELRSTLNCGTLQVRRAQGP